MPQPRRTLQLAIPAAALAALLTGASLASAQAQTPTAPPTSGPTSSTEPTATSKPTTTSEPTTTTTRPVDPDIRLSITRLPKSPQDTVGVTITGMTPGSTITSAMSPRGNSGLHSSLQTFRANSKGVVVAAVNPVPGGLRANTTYVVGLHVPMWLEDFPGLTFTYQGRSTGADQGKSTGTDKGSTTGPRQGGKNLPSTGN